MTSMLESMLRDLITEQDTITDRNIRLNSSAFAYTPKLRRQLRIEMENAQTRRGTISESILHRIETLKAAERERLLEPQPCGHPQADVVNNEDGTHFCDRCREVDEAVREETKRCINAFDGALSGIWGTGARDTFIIEVLQRLGETTGE